MKKLALAMASTVMTLSLTGCASIGGDNTRAVRVESEPAGAAIYVDNQQYGVTPAVITLPSYIYGGKTVVVRKKGYSDQALPVNTNFQMISILDVLFWPSLVVDGVTGNLVKIDPANRYLNANLRQG